MSCRELTGSRYGLAGLAVKHVELSEIGSEQERAVLERLWIDASDETDLWADVNVHCLLYTSPSPRDRG